MSKIKDDSFNSTSNAGAVDDPAFGEESFDFSAWVAGARSTRRSMDLHQRPDLLAELDQIAADRAMARDTEERAALDARGNEVARQIMESRLRVTVEARSEAWAKALYASLDEAGVTVPLERAAHLIAAQIVEPKGVTPEAILALVDVSEVQVNKLAELVTETNQQAPRVPVAFLGKGSGSRGTTGS